MDTLLITRQGLFDCFQRWEQDARDGKTQTREEVLAKPVELVAAENTDYMWDDLAKASTPAA